MSYGVLFNTANCVAVTSPTKFSGSSWTISLWVKPTTLTVKTFLLGRYAGSDHQGNFAIKLWTDGNVSFNGYGPSGWLWTWDTETSELYTQSGTITTGTWFHIAITFDGTNYVIYQNAVNKQSKTLATTINDAANTASMGIGAFDTVPDNGTNSAIQELQFYNTNLPATGSQSIASLYASGLGYYCIGNESNLVAAYHLSAAPNDVKFNNGVWVGTPAYVASTVCPVTMQRAGGRVNLGGPPYTMGNFWN